MKLSYCTLLLIAVTTFNPLFSQIQLGGDIDGEAAEDGSGSSVSLSSDGRRVAIGAPGNDGNGTDAGQVRVYEWIGESWTQMGGDIDGEAAEDGSGVSISLSSDGSRVAIGAPQPGEFGINIGYVRIYEWDGGNWTQMGEVIDGDLAVLLTGVSVSLSSNGSRIAVGAPGIHHTGTEDGRVRVYEWDGGSWAQMGGDIDGEGAKSLGSSVSLSSDGSRVAIGAPFSTITGSFSGQVRVYEWAEGSWTQMGGNIDGDESVDILGSSVSLSSDGSRVAIGASEFTSFGDPGEGYVRVYEWDGVSWTQIGEDIEGETAADHSGNSVSLSSDGRRIAIGAPGNNGNGTEAGQVRVYEWVGESWTQMGEVIDGEAEGDHSGSSVSLSSDGKRMAIGAPWNDGSGPEAGHVKVFEFSSVSTIAVEEKTIIKIAPNPTSGKIAILGAEWAMVKITDKLGRFIFKVEKSGSAIDVSSLATGIYFVQINIGHQWISKKMIKI